ncbi:hypothetical protein MXB_1770 [Myxobolus squamalis]|nr:hypothetical protein MXB_1770 [Myxobolus squamalis]
MTIIFSTLRRMISINNIEMTAYCTFTPISIITTLKMNHKTFNKFTHVECTLIVLTKNRMIDNRKKGIKLTTITHLWIKVILGIIYQIRNILIFTFLEANGIQ